MNCGAYYFDYSQITAADYGGYVFRRIAAALAHSGGLCCFNDGDIPSRQAKKILAHSAQTVPVTAVSRPSPLSDPGNDFPDDEYFYVYMVGMWTDTPQNFATMHAAFN